MKKPKFPKHLAATPADWRRRKRDEWRLVMNAIDDYTHGCAYTPSSNDLHQLMRLAARIEEDLKARSWVAW